MRAMPIGLGRNGFGLWGIRRALRAPGWLALQKLFLGLLMLAGFASVAQAAPAVAEGRLEIVVEDHPNLSRTRHFLKTQTGRLELRFKGKAPDLHSGATLRVKGIQTGQVMALDGTDTGSLAVTVAAPLPNTSGEQKVAVLLVNFQDDASQPFTLAQANDVVFNQTNAFMRENSFQSTWLSGNSFGWMTLPMSASCVTGDIATAARQAAANAGVNLSAYNRVVYVFPRNAACIWSGVGTVGGATSEAWLNGKLELKVVAHELGHNFGLQHSHSNDCDALPLGPVCTIYDYGDVADVMGANTASHFNAFQKERLGWLNNGAQPPIATALTSGTYTLSAFETAAAGAKALKILKSIDPVTAVKTWYYVEYRQPIGFDAGLASLYQSNLVNGVLIRTGTDGDRNSSYLLDMTPNTVPTFDMTDAALLPGLAFVDSAAGVTITLTSRSTTQAIVNVTMGAPSGCVRANPGVATSTSTAALAAGSVVSYSVSVTNNDNAGCGASAMNFATAVPAGWSGSFANPTLSLMPGAVATTTLSVGSATNAPAGNYVVGVRATNGSSPANSGTVNASYLVAGALLTTVVTNKAVYRSNESVVMTASVSSAGQAAANADVTFTIIKPNGATSVLKASTNASGVASATYRVTRKDPPGAWQVLDSASYLGSSASATGAFVVQ